MDLNKTRDFMRENVDPEFEFINNKNRKVPFTKLNKKIKDSKIVLISSGGFHLDIDEPFDTEDNMGDASYRMIPKNTKEDSIKISHSHYDHKYVNKDINCAFPLSLLLELEDDNLIGSLADKNYSFMGFCLKIEELKENAAKLAYKLKDNNVDAAIISPT